MNQDQTTPNAMTVPLVGNSPVLDFINTRGGWDGENQEDYVDGYDDLLGWMRRLDLISDTIYDDLTAAATHHPDLARQRFHRAITLRTHLYRIFSAIAHDQSPDREHLAHLESEYHRAIDRLELRIADRQTRWTWDQVDSRTMLDLPTWLIGISTIDLLRSDQLARLKQCPGGGDTPCGWLFLDTSRAGNRRWCSSGDCGTIFKWRRQNARRAGKPEPGVVDHFGE